MRVSRSFEILKCSKAKSSDVSSKEYQSREKSLAPTGMRQILKLRPTPGANSPRKISSLSLSSSALKAVHPSSLKHAPKPSIVWSGFSSCASTSHLPSDAKEVVAASFDCHCEVFVVAIHVRLCIQ